MRGKGRFQLSGTGTRRITPAYAGKRLRNGIHLSMSWDHPRLCGEKRVRNIVSVHIYGSPPPMRGKERYFSRLILTNGITPAYAGKRRNECKKRPLCRDHPRLCGEKRFAPASSSLVRGSPPPMRGKERTPALFRVPLGITPAYAGKSPLARQSGRFRGDHPRLCGEKV